MVCFLCAVILGLVFALFSVLATKSAPPVAPQPVPAPPTDKGATVLLVLLVGLAAIGVFSRLGQTSPPPAAANTPVAPVAIAVAVEPVAAPLPMRSVWHVARYSGLEVGACVELTVISNVQVAAPLGMSAGTCAEHFPPPALATCTQYVEEGSEHSTLITYYYERFRRVASACRAEGGEWWASPAHHRARRVRAQESSPPPAESAYQAPAPRTGWEGVPSAPAPDYGYQSGRTVRVRGYYRRDGTYVQPHTRRPPRR